MVYISPLQWLKEIFGGLYLESGFLDLLSSAICTEDAYKPAILNYDTETASYITGTSTPLQGSIFFNTVFDEAMVAVLDTEVSTANQINLLDSVLVTNAAGTTEYSSPADYTTSINGITATISGAMTAGQNILVTYTKVVPEVLAESPFSGEVIATGAESKSVGCETKLATITDPCSNIYTAGGYCDASIQAKKEAQDKIPASMFSGKLRLLVQAIYGSPRTDYRAVGLDLNVGDSVDYPAYTYIRNFANNSWLYTTDNYDYFIVNYQAGALVFKPLVLSGLSLQVRDILKNHLRKGDFAFATKLEAYILSTCEVDSDNGVSIIITGDPVLGDPLDYGWHTTWKGDKANVVCYYEDPANPQYISDQHEITISESFDGAAYTFTVANSRLLSDKAWWPFTSALNVFKYDESAGSMIAIPFPNALLVGQEGTFDAPIYNYYKFDAGVEELVTVSIYMNTATPPNKSFDIVTGTHIYTTVSFTSSDRQTYNSAGGVKGFKDSKGADISINIVDEGLISLAQWIATTGEIARGWPNDLNASFFSDSYADANAWAAANGHSIGETKELPFTNPDTGTTGNVNTQLTWRGKWVGFILRRFDQFSNVSAGNLFAQTVLGDCSQLVIGDQTESSAGAITHVEDAAPFYVVTGGSLDWVYNQNLFGKPTLEVLAGQPSDFYFNFSPFLEGTGSVDLGSAPAEPQTTNHNLHSFYNAIKSTDITAPTAGNTEYFHPTSTDLATHTVDVGRQAIGDKYKLNHTDFNHDGGFINDSSIGWV